MTPSMLATSPTMKITGREPRMVSVTPGPSRSESSESTQASTPSSRPTISERPERDMQVVVSKERSPLSVSRLPTPLRQ